MIESTLSAKQKPGIGTKSFQSEHYRIFFEHSIEEICLSLRNSSLFIDGKSELTENILFSVVSNLRTHYHKFYGKGSSKPRPITIPSSSLFEDFSLNGALHTILSSMLVGATVRNLPIPRIFECDAIVILPILYDIEKSLIARGHWFAPSFFFNRVPVHYINRFSRIILEHGGTITAKEEAASHIIDCIEDVDLYVDECETSFQYSRNSGKGIKAIHWNCWPNSYEETVEWDDDSYEKHPSRNRMLRNVHLVSGRFIIDCDEFNEWGNEADYEILTEESEDQASDIPVVDSTSSRKSKQKKRGGSQGSSQVLLRLAKESVVFQSDVFQEKFFSDVTPLHLLQAETPIIDISSDFPHFKENKMETSNNICGVKRKVECESFDGISSDNCSWLSMDSISPIEYKYMGCVISSFATGGEAAYLQLRNSVINLYVQSPSQYLSATECRRKISGDVGKIIRIHEFLDAFIAINYSVKYESRPHAVENYGLSIKRKLIVERLRNNANLYREKCDWSEKMDSSLLEAVTLYKMDWNLIASSIHERCVSPLNCMMRFLEISFDTMGSNEDSKETSTEIGINYQQTHMKNSYLIFVRRLLDMISCLDANADKTLESITSQDASIFHDSVEKSVRNLRTILQNENQDFLKDYLSNRIESIENKVKVFRHIESLTKN